MHNPNDVNDPQPDENFDTRASEPLMRKVSPQVADRGTFVNVTTFWRMAVVQYWRHGLVTIAILSGTAGFSIIHPVGIDSPPISSVGYERLDVGMSLTDAQSTLGPATEISRDETTVTYQWINSDGEKITAVFKNKQLQKKEYSRLN